MLRFTENVLLGMIIFMAACALSLKPDSTLHAGESKAQRLAKSHLIIQVNVVSKYAQVTWGLDLGHGTCVRRNWFDQPHIKMEQQALWVGQVDDLDQIPHHQMIAKKEAGQYILVCPNGKLEMDNDQIILTTPVGVVVYQVDDQDPTIYRPSKRLVRRAGNGTSWLSMSRE